MKLYTAWQVLAKSRGWRQSNNRTEVRSILWSGGSKSARSGPRYGVVPLLHTPEQTREWCRRLAPDRPALSDDAVSCQVATGRVTCVELALWRRSRPPFRSPLLAWHVLGRPGLHPEFAMDAAMRYEWHPQCGRCDGFPTCPRWPQVLKRWSWLVRRGRLWSTSLRDLHPG